MDVINKLLWGIATFFIVGFGIYFTFYFRGVQFHFKKMFSSFQQKELSKNTISPFQTLMLALAGRIGVGSIAGVALAIYIGGVGSLFWMWVTAFLAASSTFAETVLGILYKEKDEGDVYRGGPSYYMKYGLGLPWLGAIYSIFILISYIGGFLGIQANTITKSLQEIVPISAIFIGLILVIFTAFIIFGGIKKIAKASGALVPFMTVIYLLIALIVICIHIQEIPTIFLSILKEAFQIKPFITGFCTTFLIGIQRGIFSNEAGLGTGSIASSTTATNEAAKQGYTQMIGIYITTLLICSATAFMILTSNYQELVLSDINGIEITQYAFAFHLGKYGNLILFVFILLFSFSTILSGYYYGESSLKYFFVQIKKRYLLFLKIVTLIVIFLGCIVSSTILWNLVDVMVALLSIINLYTLFCMRKRVKEELNLETYYSK